MNKKINILKEENIETEETFLPIKGLPPHFSHYYINKLGQVKNMKTNYILSNVLDNGYHRVNLLNKTASCLKHVHILMAKTFLPNFNDYKTVDHRDRVKTNNKLYNLRWASRTLQNRNRKCFNSTGDKFIYSRSITKKNKTYRYWLFQIKPHKIHKLFSKNKYSYQEVVDFRDKWLDDRNYTIYDY